MITARAIISTTALETINIDASPLNHQVCLATVHYLVVPAPISTMVGNIYRSPWLSITDTIIHHKHRIYELGSKFCEDGS